MENLESQMSEITQRLAMAPDLAHAAKEQKRELARKASARTLELAQITKGDKVVDGHNKLYRADKIYQYTDHFKKNLSIEPDSFTKYLKMKYVHLNNKDNEGIIDNLNKMKPSHLYETRKIMYPQTSPVDDFLKAQGMHK